MSLFDGEVESAVQPRSAPAPVGVAEVTHDTVRDQLSEYLDDSLPERERLRVEEHLRACRACRSYRRTLEATIGATASLPRERAPASAKQRLLEIPER